MRCFWELQSIGSCQFWSRSTKLMTDGIFHGYKIRRNVGTIGYSFVVFDNKEHTTYVSQAALESSTKFSWQNNHRDNERNESSLQLNIDIYNVPFVSIIHTKSVMFQWLTHQLYLVKLYEDPISVFVLNNIIVKRAYMRCKCFNKNTDMRKSTWELNKN